MVGMSAPGGRSPIAKWWPLLLLAVVAVVIVAVLQHPSAPLAVPSPTPTPTPTPASSPTGRPPSARTTPPAPLITRAPSATPAIVDLHHPILGVTAGWELFGRAQDSVVRIQPAKGRVTRTAIPAIGSSGPVSFLAGPDRVIIRPLDFVPGYEVVDGTVARPLTGSLAVGGPALPGPDRDHLWVHADRNGNSLMLSDWQGHPSPVTATAPADSSVVNAVADGTGQVLFFSAERGVFLVQGARNRLLTGGTLDAIGAHTMVVTNCDPDAACVTSVIDRVTSRRRALPHAVSISSGAGLVSPDDHFAALITSATPTSSLMELTLLNLDDGSRRALPPTLGVPDSGRIVFSPDGRWLFVATPEGRVAAVDPATGTVSDLGIALPAIAQLAIRGT